MHPKRAKRLMQHAGLARSTTTKSGMNITARHNIWPKRAGIPGFPILVPGCRLVLGQR